MTARYGYWPAPWSGPQLCLEDADGEPVCGASHLDEQGNDKWKYMHMTKTPEFVTCPDCRAKGDRDA